MFVAKGSILTRCSPGASARISAMSNILVGMGVVGASVLAGAIGYVLGERERQRIFGIVLRHNEALRGLLRDRQLPGFEQRVVTVLAEQAQERQTFGPPPAPGH